MDIEELESHRRIVNTPSGSVSYLDVGQGRPAVFLHGLLTNAHLWRHVISELASSQRRCIVIDLPGHGLTPPLTPDADASLTAIARRIIDACEALELSKFDLVASDTGGAIGQIVAAQLGSRLSTMTLASCDTEGNCPPVLFKPLAWISQPSLLRLIGPMLARQRWLIRLLLKTGYANVRQIPGDIVDSYGRAVFGTRDSAHSFGRVMNAVVNDDLAAIHEQLAELYVPTLIVWGTRDPFFPVRRGRDLAQLIPATAGFITIDRARLHFPDYRADEFIPHLRRFWDSYPEIRCAG